MKFTMKFGHIKTPTPQISHTWSESKEQEEAVAMETLIPDMLRWCFVLPAAHATERERDVDKHKQDNVVNLWRMHGWLQTNI